MAADDSASSTPTATRSTSAQDEAVAALLDAQPQEILSLESILSKLDPKDQAEAFRILYGQLPDTLTIPEDVQAYADTHDFEVAAYKFHAAAEQRRAPRVVRVGVIQNQIVALYFGQRK